MKKTPIKLLFSLLLAMAVAAQGSAAAEGTAALAQDTRCAVCGMFVAKYPNWAATITMSDGARKHFDGVKDMMVFYFAPQKYGAKPEATIADIVVTDYYSLALVDAKQAFYVVGSDVTGPMGHELVPFATKDAALAFSKDHKGQKVLTFEAITSEQVESMRAGQRMK